MFNKLGIRSNIIRLVKSNFSLYRIGIILLLIFYETNYYKQEYKEITANDVLQIIEKDVAILFFIPLIFSLILLVATYIKDKIEKMKISENGYYRDIIEKITPVELSYIDDYDIEIRKDFIATLLQLKLKKKIDFSNEKINILDKSLNNLTSYEKAIFQKLLSNEEIVFDEKFNETLKKDIKENLKNSNLLVDNYDKLEKFESLYIKIKKIFLGIFIFFVFYLASGDEEAILSFFESFIMLIIAFISYKLIMNKDRIWKPRKKNKRRKNKTNPLLSLLIYYVIILAFCGFTNLFIDTKNYIWLILSISILLLGIIRFIKNLDLAGAIVTQLFIVPFVCAVPIMGLVSFFEDTQGPIIWLSEYIFIVTAIVFIAIEFYFYINTYKLTNKAKEIKIKLMGLKLFLKDYSNMKNKELIELNLWDEYMIYSVILNENKKVKREIMKMLKMQNII